MRARVLAVPWCISLHSWIPPDVLSGGFHCIGDAENAFFSNRQKRCVCYGSSALEELVRGLSGVGPARRRTCAVPTADTRQPAPDSHKLPRDTKIISVSSEPL